MNKYFGAAGIALALLVGAAFGPIAVNAQTDDSSESVDVESNETDRPEREGRKGPGFAETAAALEDVLGLTPDEVKEALKTGSNLAEIAAEQGVSEDALVAALVGVAEEHLDSAVADGKLDQAKADAIAENLTERITGRINGERGNGGHSNGETKGPRGGEGHAGPGGFGSSSEVLTDLLGLTPDEVKEALKTGSNLAEIAAEQGVSEDALVAALVGVAEEHLDSAVADGKLDQAKADAIAENLTERITGRINGEGRNGGNEGPYGGERLPGQTEGDA